jgi:hypothetical protein
MEPPSFITVFTAARQLVSTLNHTHPFQNIPFNVSKIHFNITLPSTRGSFKWSLSFRFPHQNHMPQPWIITNYISGDTVVATYTLEYIVYNDMERDGTYTKQRQKSRETTYTTVH